MTPRFQIGKLRFSVIFDLWFECRAKNEGEITAFFLLISQGKLRLEQDWDCGLSVIENEKVLELTAAEKPRTGTVRLLTSKKFLYFNEFSTKIH